MDLFYIIYISSEGIPTMKCSGINGSSAVSANVRLPGRKFECDVAEGLKITNRPLMSVMPTTVVNMSSGVNSCNSFRT